jgi:hypothetical protein
MASVDTGDIVRYACRSTYDTAGQDIINVVYAQALVQNSIIEATIQAEMLLVPEFFIDGARLETSNTLKYTVLEVKNITQDLLLGSFSWPTFVQGAKGEPPASPQVVGLLLLPTAKSRVMGRVNFGGLPETAINDGIMDVALVAGLATSGAVMIAPIVQGFSTYQYIVFNVEFGTFNIPTTSSVVLATRTQRRRSTGFGT